MIWTLIILFVIISFLIAFRLLTERGKYQDTNYLTNLQKIPLFFDTTHSFDDYITWIQREKIKTKYSDIGQYFKGKSNFYKREESVKKFNDIYKNFDNYIVSYNKTYVKTQKEKLSQYFDDIEGKKLDDQQRTAVITDEYSNLIIAGAGFASNKKFISLIEQMLLDYYEGVVQHMTNWNRPAPKLT